MPKRSAMLFDLAPSPASLQAKTSNRAGFRAYSSRPVAVARLNACACNHLRSLCSFTHKLCYRPDMWCIRVLPTHNKARHNLLYTMLRGTFVLINYINDYVKYLLFTIANVSSP